MDFLPLTVEEVDAAGWDSVDIVLVTGDAYIDHPAFGIAVIGRVLEAEGYRIAVLSQPDWQSVYDFRRFGRPRLFFGISSGNMDSMVNKYTALRKVRNSDAYSEEGRPSRRPDRAAIVYAQRAREAYSNVPVILGGVEASLRRLAHYDYWSDSVRRSVLLDAKADLLVYGNAEQQIKEITCRLSQGENVRTIRNIRGTLFAIGEQENNAADSSNAVEMPSFEKVRDDPDAFNRATRIAYENTNPYASRTLLQRHAKRAVVQTPPPLPLSRKELDRIYELPFSRKPHPQYEKPIPAYEMIKSSVTVMRGCFGGCSFCSIALHQGRFVQSRSSDSVLSELKQLAGSKDFSGTITDLGGPTANMYMMGGKNLRICSRCTRQSCLHPDICANLSTDHRPLLALMSDSSKIRGIRNLFIASGVRMDLALRSSEYIKQLSTHHTGGHLKVAIEHVSDHVLTAMRKPGIGAFEKFKKLFDLYSRKAGKRQYIIPYLIVSHPGTTPESALQLAVYLQKHGLKPREVQDFLPSPMSVATAMYHTGKDPFTGEKLYVARGEKEKRQFRALAQYYKPENRALFRQALRKKPKGDVKAAYVLLGPSIKT